MNPCVIINDMKNRTLEYTVFLSGAVIMTLEIVGSRVLAPYLGTSLYVWTSLIGVILASLSFGYWFGGRLADKEARLDILSFILFVAGVAILIPALAGGVILQLVSAIPFHPRWQAFLGTLILLAPASVILGMVTPYATRLHIHNLETSGRVLGSLYALSTIGSIFGTFMTGFFLLSWFGTVKILLVLALLLIFFSIFAFRDQKTKTRFGLLVLIGFVMFGHSMSQQNAEAKGIFDFDTAYNRVTVRDITLADRPARALLISGEYNSAMFLDGNDLAFPYSKFYRLAPHFNPSISRALMFGGGGYSYPKDFLASFPEAHIDVVEIDPEVTQLAKEYFDLKENPRLSIYHQDGRVFLNRASGTYDVIYNDAFSSFYAIPYQLTTREALQKMYDILSPNGVVLVNVISSLTGEDSAFIAAEFKTFKEVFPQVYLFPVEDKNDSERIQNIMLVAMKSDIPPPLDSKDAELTHYLYNFWPGILDKDAMILTDDFAPVDQLISSMAKSRH